MPAREKVAKLLIVDDSSFVRRTIARHVEAGWFAEILTASNGREALDVFCDERPEFVTLDITMPEMDGLTCLEAMLETNEQARVLVISALADRATAIEALKRGAMGFICKPFTADELNEAISDLTSDA